MEMVTPRSMDSKVMLGEERRFDEDGPLRKKTKMRDLEEVLRDKVVDQHTAKQLGYKEADKRSQISKKKVTSQTKENLSTVILPTTPEVTGQSTLSVLADAAFLNVTLLDHVPDISSNSVVPDSLLNERVTGLVKSQEESQCGSSSSIDPLEEKSSWQKWNELKRNGFLSTTSSTHGSIPLPRSLPKPRGRKRKYELVKKQNEVAKKEQIHRFTKVAAPSGLLNGLNPGIINHVRNSKQVHAIFAALVRCDKRKRGCEKKPTSDSDSAVKKLSETAQCKLKLVDFSTSVYSNECKVSDKMNVSVHSKTNDWQKLSRAHSFTWSSQDIDAHSVFHGTEKKYQTEVFGVSRFASENVGGESGVSQLASENVDGEFTITLSPTELASQNSTTAPDEDSSNHAPDFNLLVKGANVALQWLEHLYQDIKSRLVVLRRSKRRVECVLQTELPLLVSRECSSAEQRDSHRAIWTARFEQMATSLLVEETTLKNELSYVNEMRAHCEMGLQWQSLQLLVRPDIDSSRLTKVNGEREIAMKAAAASLHSVCNYVSTETETNRCF